MSETSQATPAAVVVEQHSCPQIWHQRVNWDTTRRGLVKPSQVSINEDHLKRYNIMVNIIRHLMDLSQIPLASPAEGHFAADWLALRRASSRLNKEVRGAFSKNEEQIANRSNHLRLFSVRTCGTVTFYSEFFGGSASASGSGGPEACAKTTFIQKH